MSLSAREEDKDRIVTSLETIVQTLLGNVLATIRSSVDDLGVETKQLINALREETMGSLEALRGEMLSADEGVTRETMTALETRTSLMAEHNESRLETARSDLNQRMEEVEGRLQNEHLAILERLEGAERGLLDHEATSGRISEVLDTLGHILVRENAPREAAPISSDSTPVSVTDPSPDHDGIATQVEVNLAEPVRPSEIETQPVPVDPSQSTVTEEMEGALDRVDLAASPPATTRRTPE
jgi:hypothetical protein